jgi:hypothetical protein
MAMLVFAKLFGIAGLILGATSYRAVGGALLVFDGFLLGFAAYLGIRSMKTVEVEEKDHKEILAQMMREGTLDQYLRDIRVSGADKKPGSVLEEKRPEHIKLRRERTRWGVDDECGIPRQAVVR